MNADEQIKLLIGNLQVEKALLNERLQLEQKGKNTLLDRLYKARQESVEALATEFDKLIEELRNVNQN